MTNTTPFSFITDLINDFIPLIIGIAVFIFIFGLLKYVTAGGDEDKLKSARNTIIWGIIIIAVMISVWGLVNLLVHIFGLDQAPSFTAPCIPGGTNASPC